MESASSLIMFRDLAVAVGIGLLVGLERGWQQREAESGQRVAGLRTFAVIGIAGGTAGLLSEALGPAVLGLGFIALVMMLISAHAVSSRDRLTYGITSEMAAFATYGLSALAALGSPELAAAGGVVVATLLGFKPELHRWLERLDRDELIAALKLLLISVLVLPLMPNQGFGPWQELNPYRIWLLVVVVATISFLGHFAVRVLGQKRGIITTGLFGGLASSTALTMHFSHLSRRTTGLSELLATGIIFAQSISMPRIVLVALVASPALAAVAIPPLAIMTMSGFGVAFFLYWRMDAGPFRGPRKLGPPFRLKDTLRFAVLLVVITFVSSAATHVFGPSSIYLVAAVAAVGDLNAATLSIAQLAEEAVPTDVAVRALVISAASSVLAKGALAYMLGCRRLGVIVAASAVGVAIVGFVELYIMTALLSSESVSGVLQWVR